MFQMKTLQALQLEAMRCPFELPELQQIKDIVSYAQVTMDYVCYLPDSDVPDNSPH